MSPPIRISTFAGIENEPAIAGQGNDLVAVWYQEVFRDQVGWAYSRDAGQTWTVGASLPLRSPWDQNLGMPTIATDGKGHFYLVVDYEDGVAIEYGLALYRGSFDQASFTWQPPIYPLPPIYASGPYRSPQLVSDPSNGYVYLTCTRVVTIDYYNRQYTIALTRSEDQGVTWSEPLALSSTTSRGAMPALGPDGELYVAWHDFGTAQVLMRKSDNQGGSFGPPVAVGTSDANLSVTRGGRCRGGQVPGRAGHVARGAVHRDRGGAGGA